MDIELVPCSGHGEWIMRLISDISKMLTLHKRKITTVILTLTSRTLV
jgi:hypothetical protein